MLRNEGRPWLPMAVGGGILITALVLVGAFAIPTERPISGGGGTPVTVTPDGEPIEQARWKVSVYPAGKGKPSKAQKAAVDKSRETLGALVTSVTDSLLLEGDVGKLGGKGVTRAAATALAHSKLRLPKGMSEVRTLRRQARIGVDEKATHAAALVVVAFEGKLKGERVRVLQRSRLWLQRNDGKWQVMAFSGDMGPLKVQGRGDKAGKGDGRKGDGNKRDDRRPSKKRGGKKR